MTQIITVARQLVTLQASDRELTWLPAGNVADRRSNKSLIVVTREAAATIGYSGVAEMGGVPTDDWIAGAVTTPIGEPWTPARLPNDLGRVDVGRVVRRVGEHLTRYRAELPSQARSAFVLDVQFVGWRMHNKHPELIAFRVRALPSEPQVHGIPLRDVGSQGWLTARVLATPDLPKSELAALIEDIETTENSPDGFRLAILRAMARAAEREGVGSDTLVVHLQAAAQHDEPHIRLWFESPEGRHDLDHFGVSPVAYTPWILSHWGAMGPAVMNMDSFEFEGAPFRVAIEGLPQPDLPDGVISTGMVAPRPRKYDSSEEGHPIRWKPRS